MNFKKGQLVTVSIEKRDGTILRKPGKFVSMISENLGLVRFGIAGDVVMDINRIAARGLK